MTTSAGLKPSTLDAPTAAPPQSCDVLVIGGGPAGSTISALLAQQRRHVVLLEKAQHPRFHIGESLLPANVRLFERLGLREQVAAIGMPKWGVEFASSQHANRTRLEFADAWDKSQPMAWQVRRSVLDEMLFANAAERGAHTLQGCRVRSVAFDDTGADVEGIRADGSVQRRRAAYVVDASGRDTLLAQQFGDKHRNPRHDSAAIFGHFSCVARDTDAKRAGDICIVWFEHGWFWLIPLADGSTSVGATCRPHYLKSRAKPLKDFFFDTIALAPALAERLAGATLIDDKVHATGNYAYSAQRACGARWLLAGDAFTFIDPVFSSGVYLAMANAFAGAELVAATLDTPRRAGAARRRYQAHVRRGPKAFSWFIYRMTNPAMRQLFMHPANAGRSREAVLAGDVYGGSPIGPSLLFFRAVHHVLALSRWRSAWAAWRARRRNVRDVGAVPGENVLKVQR